MVRLVLVSDGHMQWEIDIVLPSGLNPITGSCPHLWHGVDCSSRVGQIFAADWFGGG
jgi:hypothetical protein